MAKCWSNGSTVGEMAWSNSVKTISWNFNFEKIFTVSDSPNETQKILFSFAKIITSSAVSSVKILFSLTVVRGTKLSVRNAKVGVTKNLPR